MSQERLHESGGHLSAICPGCGIRLAIPEWSEPLSGDKTATLWCCQICRNAFLTTGRAIEQTLSKDAIAPLKILRALAGRYIDGF